MPPVQETFTEAIEFTSEFTQRAYPNLAKHLDPVWIEEALQATGTGTLRRRRLPAEQIVWLVLGCALYRDLPITEVARRLDIALPEADGTRTVASSALTQARERLGADPMEWLFLRTGEEWAHASAGRDRWRGLALYGVDGTTLRVADSQVNRDHFGGQVAGAHAGGRPDRVSGYPSLRLVVLMALRSHLLAAASFGPYTLAEPAYAKGLWDVVPDQSLVLFDRGYLHAEVMVPVMTQGTARHWLTRAKTTSSYRKIRRLGTGDELVEFQVSDEARRRDPSLPTHYDARAIHYKRKGHPPQLLLTSLLDPVAYPAAELRVLYHERWELELGFGELKTDMLERLETLRSKSPTSVAQEMWGLLTAYNLVRLEMERIADELKIAATRVSFVAALRFITEAWWSAVHTDAPGALPKRIGSMRDKIRQYVLPPRRHERTFPRAVKLKMSNYARKVPTTVSTKSRTK